MQNTIRKIHLGSWLTTLFVVGFITVAGSLWGAATAGIQGIVKDTNGAPLSGADVKVENKGGSSWNKVVKSDAKGHYFCGGLQAGATYRVTLLVHSQVKASINNVTMRNGNPTELNFDLRANKSSAGTTSSGKKSRHMVWIPAQTGSNLGGRWVEVEDNGTNTVGTEHVETVGKGAVNRMQSNSGAAQNSTGGN